MQNIYMKKQTKKGLGDKFSAIHSLELIFYLMKILTISGLSPQNTLGRQRSKADRSPYENYPLPLRGSQSPRTHIKTILPNNHTENNANEIYQVIKSKTFDSSKENGSSF